MADAVEKKTFAIYAPLSPSFANCAIKFTKILVRSLIKNKNSVLKFITICSHNVFYYLYLVIRRTSLSK